MDDKLPIIVLKLFEPQVYRAIAFVFSKCNSCLQSEFGNGTLVCREPRDPLPQPGLFWICGMRHDLPGQPPRDFTDCLWVDSIGLASTSSSPAARKDQEHKVINQYLQGD